MKAEEKELAQLITFADGRQIAKLGDGTLMQRKLSGADPKRISRGSMMILRQQSFVPMKYLQAQIKDLENHIKNKEREMRQKVVNLLTQIRV